MEEEPLFDSLDCAVMSGDFHNAYCVLTMDKSSAYEGNANTKTYGSEKLVGKVSI